MLQLQMSRRQRIIIIVLFGAGFLVCVAGAVRSYYTYVELVSPDITWNTYYVWISGTVELYVGIVSILSQSSLYSIFTSKDIKSTILTRS